MGKAKNVKSGLDTYIICHNFDHDTIFSVFRFCSRIMSRLKRLIQQKVAEKYVKT